MFGAFPFPAAMNSAVGFGLMNCVIEIFNGCLLVKTPLESSPMQFAVVIAVFSQHFPCYWNGGGNGLESHLRYFIKRFALTLDLIQSPIQDEIPYIGTFVDLEQKTG